LHVFYNIYCAKNYQHKNYSLQQKKIKIMQPNSTDKKLIPIKPLRLTEIAMLYETSPRVLESWIRQNKQLLGKKMGWYFTPLQINLIFEHLGPPVHLPEDLNL
jgi:hypothetical protein